VCGDLHSCPTRRSSDLLADVEAGVLAAQVACREVDLGADFLRTPHTGALSGPVYSHAGVPGDLLRCIFEIREIVDPLQGDFEDRSEEHTSELQSRDNLV